jgi:hypothetical protein
MQYVQKTIQIFSKTDYETMHRMVFRPDYLGYKPTVKEIPNGDGNVDADKKFAHIAPKYFRRAAEMGNLGSYYMRAHALAEGVAEAIGLPKEWWPDIRYGALRILDYPVGATSARHEDFDLFTLMCYRDQPECFKSEEVDTPVLEQIRKFNPQAHLGQLGQEYGLGPATPHEVVASEQPQHSIVYFAIPDHDLKFQSGITVKDWLNERMTRSRTEFKKYE